VFNASNTTPTIQNGFNDTIVFITKGSIRTESIPMKLIGPDIIPGYHNESDIGTNDIKYKTVHAVTFNGTATKSSSLQLGTNFLNASVSSSPDTIVARDADSDVFANVFHGTATSANYADLAEKYLADAEYDVGTVLMIGGDKEVTAAQVGYRALGAVSAKPAYLMNDELEGGTVVALKGRIPVKVIGHVKKGQRLVAATNGTAQATVGNNADVFAVALESSDDVNVKLVECVIL
jgi:hypothetical protein